MTDDLLFSSRIKIKRAEKHFTDLHAEIEAFKRRDPYKPIADRETEPGIEVTRLHIVEEIPVMWSATIGDILHNLMSALDSLAVALLARKCIFDEKIVSEAYFPIHWREANLLKPKVANFLRLVGPDVEKRIRQIQPYNDWKPLGRLKNLNKRDKHRAIIPVVSNLTQVTFHSFVDPNIPMIPSNKVYDLKEGDELMRTHFGERHFNADTAFHFDIAIDEDRSLLEELDTMCQLVEGVVSLFENEFFNGK